LYHPRHQTWQVHFQLDASNGRVEPLTPQARVTVFLLHLNDPDQVIDRKLLIDEDRYPCVSSEV
jgi:hypothetical protein